MNSPSLRLGHQKSMASENDIHTWIRKMPKLENAYLQKFRLYESRSNFYMVGRSKNRSVWRVLKIDRSEASELNITEDPTVYTETECSELLTRINEGNKCIGGLKLVTVCYGIVGFVKFLGPYYMLLITKRKKMGVICGHAIYAITKSEILAIPNSTIASNMDCSKNENRSFVNSACKCEMYLVFFRTIRTLKLVVDHCIMIGLFPLSFLLFKLDIHFCTFSLFPNLDGYYDNGFERLLRIIHVTYIKCYMLAYT